MKHIISLGAGVQSSTMALMAAHGEIEPMPDAAIFADTMAEPLDVYDWLAWLERQLPFPVHHVDNGSLADAVRNRKDGFNPVPFNTHESSKGRRQCTREYKIVPINRKARKLAGLEPGQRVPEPVVTMWKGISWDERQRMDTPREKWIISRFPLIERQLTCGHCLEWMQAKNYPKPPRSACVFCPYQTADWMHIRTHRPQVWNAALKWDTELRKQGEYIHPSCLPLRQAVDEYDPQQNDWLEECEGGCGL